MKKLYGVEMSLTNDKQPGFFAQIVKEMANIAHIIDRDQRLFIIQAEDEAHNLMNLFQKKNIYEDQFELFHLEQPTLTDVFTDYGFISSTNRHYLYADTTIPFQITSGAKKQVEMALYQFDEHLIGIDTADTPLYFIDREQVELIEGIARAYDIQVSFFYLDKNDKND